MGFGGTPTRSKKGRLGPELPCLPLPSIRLDICCYDHHVMETHHTLSEDNSSKQKCLFFGYTTTFSKAKKVFFNKFHLEPRNFYRFFGLYMRGYFFHQVQNTKKLILLCTDTNHRPHINRSYTTKEAHLSNQRHNQPLTTRINHSAPPTHRPPFLPTSVTS